MGIRKIFNAVMPLVMIAAVVSLSFVTPAWAEIRWIRDASGGLLSADATTPPQFMREDATEAIIFINVTVITTADGDDEVDLYVQTTYNGVDWVDRAAIHFDTGDNGTTAKRVVVFGAIASGDDIVTPTDGTLTDDTDAAIPLGLAVRIKGVTTGATEPSYNYTASVFYRR